MWFLRVAVSVGARISSLAGAGEILVSSAVKDRVADSGLHFEDRGEHPLKGVPRPGACSRSPADVGAGVGGLPERPVTIASNDFVQLHVSTSSEFARASSPAVLALDVALETGTVDQ